jgi:hypothetical protein
MKVTVTTKEILGWMERGLGAKQVGWAIIDKATGDTPKATVAFRAWENGADWTLGLDAVELCREALRRKKHLVGTFTV